MNQIFSYCNQFPKFWLGIQASFSGSKKQNLETKTVDSAAQIEAYLQEDDNQPIAGVTSFLYSDRS